MQEIKCVSIGEFADIVKVSRQAIYKQANNPKSQLAPYIHREGKKTLIEVGAISALYKVDYLESTLSTLQDVKVQPLTQENNDNQPDSAPFNPDNDNPQTTHETQTQPKSTPENQPLSTDYIEFLKGEIAELKAEKTAVESRLNATIQEKDAVIQGQAEQIAELANKVAEIAKGAILTTSQQQYLSAVNQPPESGTIESAETMKKGFLKRIFG